MKRYTLFLALFTLFPVVAFAYEPSAMAIDGRVLHTTEKKQLSILAKLAPASGG